MTENTIDFAGAVEHIRALVGTEVSVEVGGRDSAGIGTAAELTGFLRAVGPDPDDDCWGQQGPHVFGFEGQDNAFYLDPDAFVEAWSWGEFLYVTTTFGAMQIAGPIQRPDWF